MSKRKHQPRSPAPTGPPDNSKSRGGQPGNKNAYKHGFYTGLFRQHERQLLENLPAADLSAEIELIRVTSARFIQSLMASKGTLDYESNLTALRLVNLSAQSIATLLRVQALTGAAGREMAEAIHELEQLSERIEKQTAPASPLPSDADPHLGLGPSP